MKYLAFVTLALLLIQGCSRSEKAPAYHWYKVHAEFEVDGSLVSLGGVIECQGDSYLSTIVSPSGRVNYAQSTHLFSSRLSDGSALIISPNSACGYPDINMSQLFPKDYRPDVFWVDNAEYPTRMENYFSEAYFEREDARFRLKRFDVEHVSKPEDSNRIYWHTQNEIQVPWIKNGDPLAFREFSATVVNEEQWREIDGLKNILDDLREPTVLSLSSPEFQNENIGGRLNVLMFSGFSGSVYDGPDYQCRSETGSRISGSEGIRYTYGMIPITNPYGVRYSTKNRLTGVLALVPSKQRFPNDTVYLSLEKAQLSVAASQLRLGVETFDPQSRQLFRIEERGFWVVRKRLTTTKESRSP